MKFQITAGPSAGKIFDTALAALQHLLHDIAVTAGRINEFRETLERGERLHFRYGRTEIWIEPFGAKETA